MATITVYGAAGGKVVVNDGGEVTTLYENDSWYIELDISSTFSLTAEPYTSYKFKQWSADGPIVFNPSMYDSSCSIGWDEIQQLVDSRIDIIFELIPTKTVKVPWLSQPKFYVEEHTTIDITGYLQYENESDKALVTVSPTSASTIGKHTSYASLNDTVNYRWKSGGISREPIYWEIIEGKPKTALTKPQLTQTVFAYTGEDISVTGKLKDFASSTMQIDSGGQGSAIGKYTLKISLKNSTDYEWSDGTIDPVELYWEIKNITLVTVPSLIQSDFKWTSNQIDVRKGNEALLYENIRNFNSSIMNVGGNIAATNIGNYKLKIMLNDTSGAYEWDDATGGYGARWLDWSIYQCVRKPWLEQDQFEENLQEDGTFETFTPEIKDYVDTYTTARGTFSAKRAGEYKITFTLAQNHRWDNGTDSGETGPLQLSWRIISMAVVSPISSPITYDGIEHNFFEAVVWQDVHTQTEVLLSYDKLGDTDETYSGEYNVDLYLTDYYWKDTTTRTLNFKWTISSSSVKPYIWVHCKTDSDTEAMWHKAQPWVYTDKWHKAQAWIYTDKWHKLGTK